MRRAALIALLAACGDNTVPEVAPPDAPVPCTATFRGNFAETAAADTCATVDGTTLDLAIPSLTLAPSVMASFELGRSPSPGAYSPEILPAWTARGVQSVGTSVCVYNAGATAVPTGDFALRLDRVSPPHGALTLTLYVLAFPMTDCGTADTEQVDVTF